MKTVELRAVEVQMIGADCSVVFGWRKGGRKEGREERRKSGCGILQQCLKDKAPRRDLPSPTHGCISSTPSMECCGRGSRLAPHEAMVYPTKTRKIKVKPPNHTFPRKPPNGSPTVLPISCCIPSALPNKSIYALSPTPRHMVLCRCIQNWLKL